MQLNLDNILSHVDQNWVHVVDHSFNKNEATLINFRKYAEYPNLLHALCHKEYESPEKAKLAARKLSPPTYSNSQNSSLAPSTSSVSSVRLI